MKAIVFTGLLYRHWNSYNDGKRSQLFVADVKDGKTTQLTKEARDVPPFSLGGPPDYAFSADSGKVYFTRGPAPGPEAWSTNADLCVVAADGRRRRRASPRATTAGTARRAPRPTASGSPTARRRARATRATSSG